MPKKKKKNPANEIMQRNGWVIVGQWRGSGSSTERTMNRTDWIFFGRVYCILYMYSFLH